MKLAVIPCRAGSVGLPGKNKRLMLGKALFMWSVEQAAAAGCFDKIVVATDDPDIMLMDVRPAEIWPRSPLSAGPDVCTEVVLLEVILHYKPDQVCLLQATSPLRRASDVSCAVSAVEKHYESVVSVVQDYRVVPGQPRQMRQDVKWLEHCVENGSIYAFRARTFLRTLDRICGYYFRMEMPSWTRHEIDDEDDWGTVELMMLRHLLPYGDPYVT